MSSTSALLSLKELVPLKLFTPVRGNINIGSMNWHVESNYSPEWKELRFGTCLKQSISLDLFLFIKRGEKIEYWSLCLKLWVTTLSLWWYRGRLTSFALCSCIKYRDVLQTFRAQGIHCLVGGIFFVLVDPFCLWLFMGKDLPWSYPAIFGGSGHCYWR